MRDDPNPVPIADLRPFSVCRVDLQVRIVDLRSEARCPPGAHTCLVMLPDCAGDQPKHLAIILQHRQHGHNARQHHPSRILLKERDSRLRGNLERCW